MLAVCLHPEGVRGLGHSKGRYHDPHYYEAVDLQQHRVRQPAARFAIQ